MVRSRRDACSRQPTPPIFRHLQEPHQTLEAMLRPKVTTLPGHIQAVYVQNVVKLYASILQQKEQAAETEAAQEVTQLMVERLPQFVQSADLEVQERVRAAGGRALRGRSSTGSCASGGARGPRFGLPSRGQRSFPKSNLRKSPFACSTRPRGLGKKGAFHCWGQVCDISSPCAR